jgi:transcriptional/translational regulatory protein YebC/TACO1
VFADDGSAEVLTSADHFMQLRELLQGAGLQPENAEITMRAVTEVELDEDTARKALKLLDALEDLDDTQDVYSNADIPAAAYD